MGEWEAILIAGGSVTALTTLIVGLAKARSVIMSPVTELKEAMEQGFQEARTSRQEIHQQVERLQIHFDPEGGALRERVKKIEDRLSVLESNGNSERRELSGLISDLRPILQTLQEKP